MAANPNTISAGIKEVWDNVYQVTHVRRPTYPAITTTRLASKLEVGDTIHRQYRNSLRAYDMAGDGGYNRQAITDTDESLVINKEKETSFYIKELDEIQNHLPTRRRHAHDSMVAIFNQLDGDVLGNYDQYTNNLDDGDLQGVDGNGITVTTGNVHKLFTKALLKLQQNNIKMDNSARFSGFADETDSLATRGVAVISPEVYNVLLEKYEGKDTSLGDKVATNGHVGHLFGFDLFLSNSLGWSATLAFGGTNVSNGDTMTINGVTFTFVTGSVGTTPGNILVGATVADTADAIVAAINDSENLSAANGGNGAGAVGTDYVELSLANRNLLRNIVATDGTTEVTFKATGWGRVAVSETFTSSNVVFTAAKQVQHCLIGVNNAIDLVIQKTPNMRIKDRDGKVGHDVVTWTVYGYKVFQEQLTMMIDVRIRTDAF